jgi:hypothetical protein
MNKYFVLAGLVLILAGTVFAVSYFTSEQKVGDSCAEGLAKETLALTYPAQEERCKELGGQPYVFVIHEADDYGVPLVSVMCLREYWADVNGVGE